MSTSNDCDENVEHVSNVLDLSTNNGTLQTCPTQDSHFPSVGPSEPKKKRLPAEFWPLMACNGMVFVSSVCIMVLELSASRLIAKHVGNSLYTWTSVIGVVLAGITVGNYVGGLLADRFSPRRILGWLFLIASGFSFSVLWLDQLCRSLGRPDGLDWPSWVLCLVAMIFFLPSVALGTISPVVASLALSRSSRTGITVGNVYAWGALGSIVGTFLTGFFLIDLFGTKAIVGMTAATLALMGVVVATGQAVFRTAVCCGWFQFLLFAGLAATAEANVFAHVWERTASLASRWSDPVLAAQRKSAWSNYGRRCGESIHQLGLLLKLRNDSPQEYHDESSYSYINVAKEVEDGDDVKFLKLDKLIHSYYNPHKPTELYYEYEKIYAAATERVVAGSKRPAVVPLKSSSSLTAVLHKLPPGVRYNAAKQQLEIEGALSPAQRQELLRINPASAYFEAVRELHRLTNQPDWGGFSSTMLAKLPAGVVLPPRLMESKKLRFDSNMQMLSSYEVLTDDDLAALTTAGAVNQFASLYRATDELHRASRRVSTLFIGGGGFIFPRWIEAKFANASRIDVAELDPAVKLAVQKELGLPPDDRTAVKTHIGDARNFVDDRLRQNARQQLNGAAVRYDFVYGDAFNDFSVPWHLTTLEFTEKIKSLLTPDGVYLVNIIDIYPRTEYPEQKYDVDGNDLPLHGTLPRELVKHSTTTYDWERCGDEFHNVEIYQVEGNGGYRLGVRGVMSAEQRDRLLALHSGNSQYRAAVESLYRASGERRAGQFLGSFVNTLAQVFPNVYVFCTEQSGYPSERRDTFVLIASAKPINMEQLQEAGGYWSGAPFAALETDETNHEQRPSGQMAEILRLARGIILTDDYAPVDNFLKPVFVDQG